MIKVENVHYRELPIRGALVSLSYDKRQIFSFDEHISVNEKNATCFTRSFTNFFPH